MRAAGSLTEQRGDVTSGGQQMEWGGGAQEDKGGTGWGSNRASV